MNDTHTRILERSELEKPIVFFDGICGLCNRFVDFVLKHDSLGRFQFAPLQGETARQWLPDEDTQQLKSVVLLTKRGIYRRTAAVVRILLALRGWWKLWGILFWLIPSPVRNLLYGFIAQNRYRFFGQTEHCRFPSPEEAARLLR